jgi:hypothetical protein
MLGKIDHFFVCKRCFSKGYSIALFSWPVLYLCGVVPNAGKILELFIDETIPDETIFGAIKERAFAILTKEQFAPLSRYMTNAILDESAYEWEQYGHDQ